MACLAVVLVLTLAQAGGASLPPALRLDEPCKGVLRDGTAAAEYTYVGDKSSEVAVSLCSYDFDALLRVHRDGSAPVEIGAGGVATDAWGRLALRSGERVRIEVAATDGSRGDFELLVSTRLEPLVEDATAPRLAADHHGEAARRARGRGDDARAVRLFRAQAEVLDAIGPLARARAAYEAMLECAQRAGQREESLLARARMARIELLLGEVRRATEELVRLREETCDAAVPTIRILVFSQLARSALRQGRFGVADECCEEMRTLAVAQNSKRAECEALYLQADARTKQWKLPAAEQLLARAMEAARESGEPGLTAEVELHYALHYVDRGKLREAYEHLLNALALEPSRRVRIDILGNLGTVLFAMHRSDEARGPLEDSLNAAREIGLEAYVPKYLHAFGELEAEEGNFDVAISMLERALEEYRDDAFLLDRAQVLLSLAAVRRERRAATDGEALQRETEQVLEIGRRAGSLRLQVDAAILPYSASDLSASDPAHRKLLDELAKKAETSPDLQTAAKIAGILGWDDFTRGRYAEAVQLGNRAYERFADLGDEGQCLEALDTVAHAAVRLRDADELARAIERATLLLDREVRSAPSPEADASLREFITRFEPFSHDLIALRLARPGLSVQEKERIRESGFETTGSWKARSLVESMIRRRQGTAVRQDDVLRTARADHAEAREQIEAVSRMNGPAALLEEAQVRALAARRRVEELESAARVANIEKYPDLLPRGKSPGAVRAVLLDARTMLIEYAAGTDRLYAYVLTRDRFDLLTLGERDPIERDARAFVSLLATGKLPEDARTPLSRGIEGIARLGVGLYAELLGQALDWGGPGVSRLVLVPTTELAAVPFEALIETPPRGDDTPLDFSILAYVIRDHTVISVPSSTALVALASGTPRARRPSVLLFADPVYPEPALARESSLRTGRIDPLGELAFDRLTNSRDEVTQIASVIASSASRPRSEDERAILEIRNGQLNHHESTDGFELWLGPDATPKRFCERAGRFNYLHIAAHGLRAAPGSSDPLLALSADEDGTRTLSCSRILSLKLDADLVVLAACDTARGRRIDGEGIRSIASAFLHAGARSVVSSLWEAADLQTADLMKSFYGKLIGEGLTPEDALRQVKLRLLEGGALRGEASPGRSPRASARFADSSDPYYWAGIVYCGPPR